MPNLHLKDIRTTTVPFPPFNKQTEFADRIAVINKTKEANLASLGELETLFTSLQLCAFRGEL